MGLYHKASQRKEVQELEGRGLGTGTGSQIPQKSAFETGKRDSSSWNMAW